jgi:hypothetical protein
VQSNYLHEGPGNIHASFRAREAVQAHAIPVTLNRTNRENDSHMHRAFNTKDRKALQTVIELAKRVYGNPEAAFAHLPRKHAHLHATWTERSPRPRILAQGAIRPTLAMGIAPLLRAKFLELWVNNNENASKDQSSPGALHSARVNPF